MNCLKYSFVYGILMLLGCSCSTNPFGPVCVNSYPNLDTIVDPRDGEIYQIVSINGQRWFAENLRYNAPGSFFSSDNPCDKFGRLYDWKTAMSACPYGWHLPSDADWDTLENYTGGTLSDAALRSVAYWRQGPTGTNSTGFNAYPAGFITGGEHHYLNERAFFWSSESGYGFYGNFTSWYRLFTGWNISEYDHSMASLMSCRCVEGELPCQRVFCGPNSYCDNGVCICDSGYVHDSFTGECVPTCIGISCGANAYCYHGECVCDSGYTHNPLTGDCMPIQTFTDPRDGEVYEIITLGSQTWFAENLRYNAAGSNYVFMYAYNNTLDPYGRYYIWDIAKTACPSGWHLPTDTEWNTLEQLLGMSASGVSQGGFRGTHGTIMRSEIGWINDTNGTNLSSFNVFPSGSFGSQTNLSPHGFGSSAWFWTASQTNTTDAWGRYFEAGEDGVNRVVWQKTRSLSCRCIKD